MSKYFNWLTTIAAGIGAGIGVIFGGWDVMMYGLLGFVIADYITGLLQAAVTKTLSSEIGFRGICKKVLIFVVVAVAVVIDNWLKLDSALRTATIWFYASMELVSILENVAKAGLPVPQKLIDMLAQVKSLSKKSVEDTIKVGVDQLVNKVETATTEATTAAADTTTAETSEAEK